MSKYGNHNLEHNHSPCLSFDKKVQELTVDRGQFITIWLNKAPDFRGRNAVQVELRVTPDGKPQVFSHLKELEVLDFDTWEAMQAEKM